MTYRVGTCPNPNRWKIVHFDKLRLYTPREPVDFSWLDDVTNSNAKLEPPEQVDLSIEIGKDEVENNQHVPVDAHKPAPVRVGSSNDVSAAPTVSAEISPRARRSSVSASETPTHLPVSTTGYRPIRIRRKPRHLQDYDINS